MSTWTHCPALLDAINEDVGIWGDFDRWLGERATPTAPCGHLRHRVAGRGDAVTTEGLTSG